MVVYWKGCRTVKEDILEANVPTPVGLLKRMDMTHWLQDYFVETSIATIVDESERLKIDTKHLRELSFRVGSVYQFIGELLIQPDNEVSGKLQLLSLGDFWCRSFLRVAK
ncbi:hypothetical protein ACFX13_008949 [Malus domestica]